MLKANHLGRYADLALLLTRYGLKDFRLQFDPDQPMEDLTADRPLEPEVQERAEAFARQLQDLGPTYIKFGQVLSTRPDIVPPEYIETLEALQDSIDPFPFEQVKEIIESELQVRISKLFEEIDEKPIAAASLGQAHRAVLRDGREVVIKVQRPGIVEVIRKDLEIFRDIAKALETHTAIGRKMNLVGTVNQAAGTLMRELNYLQEARNAETLKHNLAEFEQIYVPAVINDLTTEKVLTTELVRGRKVSKLTGLSTIDTDYGELAAVLTHAYLKQICVDGFWHSDPHPGNVFIHGDQIILLDFGMVGKVGRLMQDEIVKLLLGLSENRGDMVAEVCMKMGTVQQGFDEDRFVKDITQLVTEYYDVDLRRASIGQLMFRVISIANANELQVPSELALLAKTLLHLDSLTRKLDPDFSPVDVIGDYSEQLIAQKVRQKFAPRNFYPALLDLNALMIDLPGRSRDLLDRAAAGKLSFQLQLSQLDTVLKGMHKIANRITVGAIIAALLIASALLMRVPAAHTIFGYPAISMAGYLLATIIGVYLVVSILVSDHKDREKARGRPIGGR